MKRRHLGHASIIKGKTLFDSDGSKGGLPTKRNSGSTRTNMFTVDRHDFAEGFVSFRTLCGV